MSENNINVDMVIQSTSPDGKKTDVTFTIKREDLDKTLSLVGEKNNKLNYTTLNQIEFIT